MEVKNGQNFLNCRRSSCQRRLGFKKKGLRNNLGFEGLSVSKDEKQVWLWSESSLLQSTSGDIEVLEYSTFNLKKPSSRFFYKREKPQSTNEIFRGVSEAISVDKDRFLVLERSLEVTATKGREIKAGLFLYNKNHQSKIKLYHLDGDYAGNWEGLSLQLEPQSVNTHILIIASDNNFESGTPTEFLFFRYTP
ncbi:MAG: esterase-like activity of phytase family protein [Bdellovibrionales bacterium]